MSNPNEASPKHAEIDPISFMLQMQQQQQLTMQEQMTNLMARLLPTGQHAPTPLSRHSRVKPERPVIEPDSSDNKWIIFKDAWLRYKEMTQLNDPTEIRNELRSACNSSVNEMLFNFIGPDALHNATEEQLLEYIKSVAVKTVHPEVYRQQFFVMRQSDGETITSFISRLKSQAMLCAFNCGNQQCTMSFSEDMIKSQIIAGLRDTSHQSKILAEITSLPTLNDLTRRLLTLESTARASNHFRPAEITQVAQFKSASSRKFPPPDKTKNDNGKCKGCGHKAHPKGRRQCPAWGKSCHKCGKENHFSTTCHGTASSNAIMGDYPNDSQDEDSSFISTMTVQPK